MNELTFREVIEELRLMDDNSVKRYVRDEDIDLLEECAGIGLEGLALMDWLEDRGVKARAASQLGYVHQFVTAPAHAEDDYVVAHCLTGNRKDALALLEKCSKG